MLQIDRQTGRPMWFPVDRAESFDRTGEKDELENVKRATANAQSKVDGRHAIRH